MDDIQKSAERISVSNKIIYAVAFLVWVAAAFYAAQFALMGVMIGMKYLWLQFSLPQVSVDSVVLSTVVSGVVYVASLAVAIYVPKKLFKQNTTKVELGVQVGPTLRDIGLAPLALIVTSILSILGILAASALFSGFDPLQTQSIPFDRGVDYSYWQLLLIFLTLVVVAPVAEELLFRGYLYAKLRSFLPAVATVVLTSLLFAALHLGFGKIEDLQWNVAINTFALALGMGVLREYTKSIWAGVFVHVIKNCIAFLLLFVASSLLPI